jgi:hypothetical protein
MTPMKVSPYARSSQMPKQTSNFVQAKTGNTEELEELEPPQKR